MTGWSGFKVERSIVRHRLNLDPFGELEGNRRPRSESSLARISQAQSAPRSDPPTQVLDVHVVVQPVYRAFAAIVGLIDPAEGCGLCRQGAFIDTDDA